MSTADQVAPAPGQSGDTVTFTLIEFNTRRLMRGAVAAKVAILLDGEQVNWLWMTPKDCRNNIAEFGPSDVLDGVIAQYRAHGVTR